MKTIVKKILAWIKAPDGRYLDYPNWLRKRGIKVGKNVRFRYPQHTVIDLNRPTMIEFGDNLDINDNFTVLTHDFGTYVFRNLYHDFVNCCRPVKVGSNIVIGRDVTILGGGSIGDNSIVALGSLITKPMPPNSVICGRPAKVMCSIDEYYIKRKSLQIQEAIDYGISIIERKGRDPIIEDFPEEWVLFLTKEEYESNTIVKNNVDFRMSKYLDEFFLSMKPFNGFLEFKNSIIKAYNERMMK